MKLLVWMRPISPKPITPTLIRSFAPRIRLAERAVMVRPVFRRKARRFKRALGDRAGTGRPETCPTREVAFVIQKIGDVRRRSGSFLPRSRARLRPVPPERPRKLRGMALAKNAA